MTLTLRFSAMENSNKRSSTFKIFSRFSIFETQLCLQCTTLPVSADVDLFPCFQEFELLEQVVNGDERIEIGTVCTRWQWCKLIRCANIQAWEYTAGTVKQPRKEITDQACIIVYSNMNYMLTEIFYRPLAKTERSTSPVATMQIKGNEFTFF